MGIGLFLCAQLLRRHLSWKRSRRAGVYICDRKVKVVTGAKSQTVNICANTNILGQYDYIVRLRPPFISPEALALKNFDTIVELVRFLERSHGGLIERAPTTTSISSARLSSTPDQPIAITAGFRAWRDAWDRLGNHGRVDEVVELWNTPVPDPWMRSETDTPLRLLSGERYTRKNLLGGRRGEHVIEHEILVRCFSSVTCLDQPLLDGVNAFPFVKDSSGGRNGDVEADLVILAARWNPPASSFGM